MLDDLFQLLEEDESRKRKLSEISNAEISIDNALIELGFVPGKFTL